jgi:hypothetical protein
MSVVYSGYNPDVVNPKVRRQTASQQMPFFFGGSQIPHSLNLKSGTFSGSGMMGKGHLDMSVKRGDKIFHNDGKFVKMIGRPAFKK